MSKRPVVVVYRKRRHKPTLQQLAAQAMASEVKVQPAAVPIRRVSAPRIEKPFCQQMSASVFRSYRGWLPQTKD